MQTTRTLALSLLFSCATSPLLFAQTPAAAPAASPQSAQPRQSSMFGYAFQQINPGDRDYGAALTAARQAVAAQTVDNLYFWSNCATLTLLAGMTGFCLLQIRSSEKKERIASALIAQLWNGRVSDKIEIERRTAEYNALVEKHDAIVERSLASNPAALPSSIRRSAEKPRVEVQQTMPSEAGAEQPLPARLNEAQEASETFSTIGQTTTADASFSLVEDGAGKAKKDPEAVPASMEKSAQLPAIPQRITGMSKQLQSPAVQVEEKSVGAAVDPAESVRMNQELVRLRSQVDAYRNTEKNLKERLNRQEQYIERVKGMQPVEDKN